MSDIIILCTKDELVAMCEQGEIDGDARVITTEIVFDVLCEHYGVDPHWSPNDVY
jgi:hypothetical protein